MLQLRGVQVRYGRRVACRDITLRLGSGVHALIGPNGAGKSSLLSVLATLREPASGEVILDQVAESAERRRKTGFLPQENLPEKSSFEVADFLAYMAWLRCVPPAERLDEVARVLAAGRLTNLASEQIRHLSGGQRRRVGIAAAMVGKPRLLLLDEPSSGLDIAQRALLTRVIQESARDSVVVVSTHIVEDILDSADTVTVISSGEVLFHGEDFAPRDDLAAFVQRYLGLVGESGVVR